MDNQPQKMGDSFVADVAVRLHELEKAVKNLTQRMDADPLIGDLPDQVASLREYIHTVERSFHRVTPEAERETRQLVARLHEQSKNWDEGYSVTRDKVDRAIEMVKESTRDLEMRWHHRQYSFRNLWRVAGIQFFVLLALCAGIFGGR